MAQQKKNPYPNGNFAIMVDYLEELIKITSKEKGLTPISDNENGYEDILLNEEVKSLNIPVLAASATIMVESNKQVENGIAMRFKENGGIPSQVSGFGLGHNDIYELVGKNNLENFKVIGIHDVETTLRVQYYMTGQDVEQT